jgi:hypothetical protein
MSLLHDLVKRNDLDNVQKLLKKEGKHAVNKRDGYEQTPLHLACSYGFLGLVEFLLSKGADVHAIDKHGWSPLHSAANSGEYEIRLANYVTTPMTLWFIPFLFPTAKSSSTKEPMSITLHTQAQALCIIWSNITTKIPNWH